LLPFDDPVLVALVGFSPETVAAVAADGTRLDEWFIRWQEAKKSRAQVVESRSRQKRSVIRKSRKRGGASTTRARDIRNWNKWWSPTLGKLLPAAATEEKITEVAKILEAEKAPNTVRTHIQMIKAFRNWLVDEGKLHENPISHWMIEVDPGGDRRS
jgi:hypothetical protein